MEPILGSMLIWTLFALMISIVWDVYTYDKRQDDWEREHPGATYIRGYRKLTATERKARS